MTETLQIRRADINDGRRIAQTMTLAFQADPVSCWLLPDPDDRAHRHPAFFRAFVDYAIRWGEVQVTGDFQAAALWVDFEPGNDLHPEQHIWMPGDALGPSTPRFRLLEQLMEERHPGRVRHAYLMFVAVVPQLQEQGIGGLLLANKLDELDRLNVPAYLEASSERSGKLYQRLGFTRMALDIQLPGGPTMYPMWRSPRLAAA